MVNEELIEKTVTLLAENFDIEKNKLKVVEECAELQEVLVKSITKTNNLKPDTSKIVEEMGDTLFRIMVLAKSLDVGDQVNQRIHDKSQQMYNWASKKFK